jgi:hypothetical protein
LDTPFITCAYEKWNSKMFSYILVAFKQEVVRAARSRAVCFVATQRVQQRHAMLLAVIGCETLNLMATRS